MNVSDVMNRTVRTIDPNASIQQAAELMSKYRIGSLIVVEKGKLAGIITEHDILSKVVAQAKDVNNVKVKDVMTRNVIVVSPDMELEDAAQLMLDKGIKKLPVVSNRQLIGIITATDICTAEPKLIQSLSTLLALTKRNIVAG
jgi:CBS domain-containing protein